MESGTDMKKSSIPNGRCREDVEAFRSCIRTRGFESHSGQQCEKVLYPKRLDILATSAVRDRGPFHTDPYVCV